jgi:hypothetical protein
VRISIYRYILSSVLTLGYQGANPCISNCGEPTLPSCGTTGAARKIGYYAGWGDRRPCGTNVAPHGIAWTGFTAAHFAFATISQGSQIRELFLNSFYGEPRSELRHQRWTTPTSRFCRSSWRKKLIFLR